jgi:GNAT superfamily N-acetyltransferase
MSLPLSVHLATCTPSTVGFLRVVTDTVTRSWLEDLFVLREHRRRGIAAALVRAALGHPAVSGTTTTVESPPDVQALFTGQGFRPVADTWTRRLATDRARFATAVGQEPSVNCLHRPTADRPQRVGHDTSRGEGDERHQP